MNEYIQSVMNIYDGYVDCMMGNINIHVCIFILKGVCWHLCVPGNVRLGLGQVMTQIASLKKSIEA